MAAENFCALVRKVHGNDVSLMELERNAGVPRSRNPLRHYFREDTHVDWPPHPQTIFQLARITGIEPEDIYLAFRRDAKYLQGKTDEYELDASERAWVDSLREIPPELVNVALRMVAGLRPETGQTATG